MSNRKTTEEENDRLSDMYSEAYKGLMVGVERNDGTVAEVLTVITYMLARFTNQANIPMDDILELLAFYKNHQNNIGNLQNMKTSKKNSMLN